MSVPLIVIAGPTASGKTELGVKLCKRFNGEVISADSMQIYKEMNIATAKPNKEEMQGVPHHLINIISPEEAFSVADFQSMAQKCAEDITKRGRIPVIVGGTGMYIDTFVDNVKLSPERPDTETRIMLQNKANTLGEDSLYEELKKIDPSYAGTLHKNNVKRVIRALELFYTTGKTMTQQIAESKTIPSAYDCLYIVLDVKNRAYLYDRINQRVDNMLKAGLLDEAKAYTLAGSTASQAIGYKEIIPYLNGEQPLEQCIEKLKQSTRRYAKRQLTWFRKRENAKRFYIDDYKSSTELFESVSEAVEKFGFNIQGK